MGLRSPFIAANPRQATVVQGAKLRFTLVYSMALAERDEVSYIEWYAKLYADTDKPGQAKEKEFKRRTGSVAAGGSFVWETEFETCGRWVVYCVVRGDEEYVVEYVQNVATLNGVLAYHTGKLVGTKMMSLREARDGVDQWLTLLDAIDREHPTIDPAVRKRHETQRTRYSSLRSGYDALIRQHFSSKVIEEYPIRAFYLSERDQRMDVLNVSLTARLTPLGQNDVLVLVEWTNPLGQGGPLVVEVEIDRTAPDKNAAILRAFKRLFSEWDSVNRYPPGTVQYFISDRILRILGPDCPHEGHFATTGRSSLGTISGWIDWISTGTMLIAGIVSMVMPIPGSQAISALIWISIFSGVAAAGLNIWDRHQAGIHNTNEDFLDGLAIVSSLLGAGALARNGRWIRCAAIEGLGAGKTILYGQITADSIQGIFLLDSAVPELESILNDPQYSPDERARRLLDWCAATVVRNGLTYINIKGNARDVAALKEKARYVKSGPMSKSPEEKLKELKDNSRTVTPAAEQPKEGHTDEGRHKTTTNEERGRLHDTPPPPGPRRARKVFGPAPEPESRGMRPIDHMDLLRYAQDHELIIVVRDSNPACLMYIGKVGYLPKPMKLKAKTLREGKFIGLAAAAPDDPGLIAMFKKDKVPSDLKTPDGRPHPRAGKNCETYEDVLHVLDANGFTVSGKEQDHVIRKKGTGELFYSDLDIHGIYTRGGQKLNPVEMSAVLRDLNNVTKVKDRLVQHYWHDVWDYSDIRDVAGQNWGPQAHKGVTVYAPDEPVQHFGSNVAEIPNGNHEMRQYYEEHDIEWPFPNWSRANP